MATHFLKTTQKIPADISTVWDFFSNPSNLRVITPTSLDFKIISEIEEEEMYAGQIVEYTVKPLLGIPIYWVTEITHVEKERYFIDEQRNGPYSMWHHKHHFKSIHGGTEMRDVVHYQIPLNVLGDIINKIIVKDKLKEIFEFRFNIVEERFGKWPDPQDKILIFR